MTLSASCLGQFRAVALIFIFAGPVAAQQAGWSYSPLQGEGDRAAIGCSIGATTTRHSCLVVRCEDDFSIGIHIATSRPQGNGGDWAITIDKETRTYAATTQSIYGARISGSIDWILDGLKNGAVAYLQPLDGSAMPDNHIALDGSLYSINRALAWCAPRVPTIEPNAPTGV